MIARCGNDTGCEYENYDAADGIWAFSAPYGGTIYQDGINLIPGATYDFTWYWKADSSVADYIEMGGSLSSTSYTNILYGALVGSNGFQTNLGWQLNQYPIQINCDMATNYGEPQSDGTVTYRLIIDGKQDPNIDEDAEFIWYVDEVRIQRTADPPTGFACCGSTSCPTSTTSSATSATSSSSSSSSSISTTSSSTAPSATPTFDNGSFEETVPVSSGDLEGSALKPIDWTILSGCADYGCGISTTVARDGTNSFYTTGPIIISPDPVELTIGTTYIFIFWTNVVVNSTLANSASGYSHMWINATYQTPGSGISQSRAAAGSDEYVNSYSWIAHLYYLTFDDTTAAEYGTGGSAANGDATQTQFLVELDTNGYDGPGIEVYFDYFWFSLQG